MTQGYIVVVDSKGKIIDGAYQCSSAYPEYWGLQILDAFDNDAISEFIAKERKYTEDEDACVLGTSWQDYCCEDYLYLFNKTMSKLKIYNGKKLMLEVVKETIQAAKLLFTNLEKIKVQVSYDDITVALKPESFFWSKIRTWFKQSGNIEADLLNIINAPALPYIEYDSKDKWTIYTDDGRGCINVLFVKNGTRNIVVYTTSASMSGIEIFQARYPSMSNAKDAILNAVKSFKEDSVIAAHKVAHANRLMEAILSIKRSSRLSYATSMAELSNSKEINSEAFAEIHKSSPFYTLSQNIDQIISSEIRSVVTYINNNDTSVGLPRIMRVLQNRSDTQNPSYVIAIKFGAGINAVYLCVEESECADFAFDWTAYDHNKELMDGGLLSSGERQFTLNEAVLEVCKLVPDVLKLGPVNEISLDAIYY